MKASSAADGGAQEEIRSVVRERGRVEGGRDGELGSLLPHNLVVDSFCLCIGDVELWLI